MSLFDLAHVQETGDSAPGLQAVKPADHELCSPSQKKSSFSPVVTPGYFATGGSPVGLEVVQAMPGPQLGSFLPVALPRDAG